MRRTRLSCVELKTAELAEGQDFNDIIYYDDPESLMLRQAMNRHPLVMSLPVEIIGMIFELYVNEIWISTNDARAYIDHSSGFLEISCISYV